jgi:KDO2-lipid IV(A) lauroyltransferase
MGRRRKLSFIKSLRNYVVYLLFELFAIWVKRIYLFGRVRRRALGNLRLALGSEKSEEERKRICRDVFKNIGKDLMEVSRPLDYEDSYLKTLARLEGKEYLDQALKEGKGVIAISAHLGNFPLMAVRLVNEGYPLSIVAKITKNPKTMKSLSSYINAIGIELIPDKPRMVCVARCVKTLKENRILMIQIDLNAPITEAWVDFFGYLVPTYKGPVVLSFRTGAPIVPMFIIRNAHQHHKITIHPSCDLHVTEDRQQDMTFNTAQLTKMVEAVIREHPEQWWWVHHRFKRARDIQTGKSIFPKHP